MPDPRDYQTEAVIISKIKLGEADRILTLCTPDHGKIRAVAKGVRRPNSKMAGHLELLTYSQIRLARGRNLETVTGCQTIEAFIPLKNDLWLTSSGLYAAELINQFTVEHLPNPVLFQLFLETLHRLSRAECPDLTLRYFELHLLELAGFRPQLHECVACRLELRPEVNAFHPAGGGILCTACRVDYPASFDISLDALKVLRLFQRSSFAVVSRLKVSSGLAQELKSTLAAYIRFLLERDVKSAAWLDTLAGQSGPGPEKTAV